MEPQLSTLLVVCPLVFLAGLVDSIAGGGGIISLPAYLFAGLPVHLAYGTNKFAMSSGTLIATLKYARSGCIRWKPALCSVAGALIGSWCGAQLVIYLDEKYLKYSLLVILPMVAAFLLFNRNFGRTNPEREATGPKLYLLAFAIGLLLGAYDGFIGPGTGTFLTLAFTGLLGFSLISASGNARVVNLASNVAALAAYILGGKVLFWLGIPAALCAIAGNYLGARAAVKRGERFIRPVILLSVALLFVHMILELTGK
ncbi:sulfite exporter TauE/SafE family protein [Ligaoa zhengdingensis]|uniref:sulfite exporter TauE/SafE family protein n=1 Tax=Ligaoa zhengdingensis TaxID=2763658 RepID=UPI0031BB2979